MTDKRSPISETELSSLFEQERQSVEVPSDAFSARLLRDADDVQVEIQRTFAAPRPKSRRELPSWINWIAWPTGMATAALAGVWIGFASGPEIALGTSGFWSSDIAMDLAVRVPAFTSYVEGY